MTEKVKNFWRNLLLEPYSKLYDSFDNLPNEAFKSPYKLAKHLNIPINRSSKFPENFSGEAITVEGRNTIFINSNKSKFHRDYTIFHEIVHCMIHLDSIDKIETSKAEFQAEILSYSLLLKCHGSKEAENYIKENPSIVGMHLSLLILGGGSLLLILGSKLKEWWITRSKPLQNVNG